MGKIGGKGKNIKDVGGNEVAEIQADGKENDDAKGDAAVQTQTKQKKKKKEKVFDPLSDEPITFKKIDFENALTAEEKAARKAEKLAKKGGKKKKEKTPKENPPEREPPQLVETKPKPKVKEVSAEETPKEDKPKKEKKDKKGKEKGEKKEKAEKAPAEKKKKDKDKKTSEADQEATKKSKGKKGKNAETKTQSSETKADQTEGTKDKSKTEGGGSAPAGKGKKGKGKRGKKDKKDVQDADSKLTVEMSISAFLQQREASMQADDDEWTWESYTDSTVSVTEEVPKKQKKGAEKGKVKKKKKEQGKPGGGIDKESASQKEKEKEESSEEDEFDIMAQIRKMKEMAEAQMRGDVEEEQPTPAPKKRKEPKKEKKPKEVDTEQKGPKKKLSKREKAILAAARAEQARIQAELDAIRAEEEERLRIIEERRVAIEKQKREIGEQCIRTEQLNYSINLINVMKKNNMKKAIEHKNQYQFEQFLKCDGLPDPYVCGQLSTYLHLWGEAIQFSTIDDIAVRTVEILKLMDLLATLIDDPIGVEESQVENWKWIQRIFRELQRESLDVGTYKLLRNISQNLNRVNFFEADFQRKENDFALRLWLLIQLPPSMPKVKKVAQKRIVMDAPEMRMTVVFPTSVQFQRLALRAMYVKYDHLSDQSASFEKPPVPEQFQQDLYKVTLEEWYSKIYYKYQNRTIQDNDEPSEEKPVVDREKGIIPIVPYEKLEPTASAYFNAEEDAVYLQIRDNLLTKVDEHVINLRKYIILGGTYSLDLYCQPPQPQDIFTYCMTVTRLEIPKCLNDASFHINSKISPPIDPNYPVNPENPTLLLTPEEVQAERIKREEQLDQLMLFTVTLPDYLIWFDLPIICHWDEKRRVWSTEDVFDLKYSVDKSSLTFRSSAFGCFSFAAYKYANLPYQAWNLKPETNGTVTLQITAAILSVEFNVKDNLICVKQFQNVPIKFVRDVLGIYYRLPKLIRILQMRGIDIFPAVDAFCYIEGSCEKHWPIEQHTYYNMAQLSSCYNFAWSHWNLVAGRRNIVMQMRLYKPDKDKQIPHSMLLATPLRTFYIQCTENSEEFTDEIIEGMHFYSDLYNLMKGTTSMTLRSKVQSTSSELVAAVAELLIATRIVSFS